MTPEDIEKAFYSSPEYFSAHGGNNRDWIESLYQRVLGRGSDASGMDNWLGHLQGGSGRFDVAHGFVESTERHTTEVEDSYATLFNRSPDDTGLRNWVGLLDRDILQHEDLLVSLATSHEFELRHGDDDLPGHDLFDDHGDTGHS